MNATNTAPAKKPVIKQQTTVKPIAAAKALKGLETKVMKVLGKGTPLRARVIADTVGSDTATVKIVIDQLLADKRLKTKGQRAGMMYFIPTAKAPAAKRIAA